MTEKKLLRSDRQLEEEALWLSTRESSRNRPDREGTACEVYRSCGFVERGILHSSDATSIFHGLTCSLIQPILNHTHLVYIFLSAPTWSAELMVLDPFSGPCKAISSNTFSLL